VNQMPGAIVDRDMDVYLVPVAADRYELYCEVPDEPESPEAPPGSRGYFHRMRVRFHEMIAEAERERRKGPSVEHHAGWIARAKARTMRWIAESIAEQRLLWHMRRQDTACLYYPDDLTEALAVASLRTQLGRDRDKHRFWLIIDTIGFVLSGLLMLLPGPNVLAYYFAFRLVGHYLSMMGARRGLDNVDWRNERSAPLSDLRRALGLDPERRVQHVHDVALRLRLEHLASFFERTAATTTG